MLCSINCLSLAHAEQDSAKVIRQCHIQLLAVASANLDASWATFLKKKSIGIQLINRRLTLTYTSFYNKKKIKHIEVRNAIIPLTLNDFPDFVNCILKSWQHSW